MDLLNRLISAMRLHFIAIGGAAMHNIAIALHLKGNSVTGSDDEIFEPARSHLQSHGLLPAKPGWHPEKITREIDTVILGMHARVDNPELQRAQKLGLKIVSFPEYLYEQTKDKKRVVIGGSHGKTTITSMTMHVLKYCGMSFDYMVGSMIEGFDTMAALDEKTTLAVFEGDEYLSSPVDPRPKFHLYRPHIAVISGIAWDHINVFPTFEEYCMQFMIFAQKIQKNGVLIYYNNDSEIRKIVQELRPDIRQLPYGAHPHRTEEGKVFLTWDERETEVPFFGDHNMQNVSAALMVCSELGIDCPSFYKAIGTFKGAKKRLQRLAENDSVAVFSDFAHSPSKLLATIHAVKSRYPRRHLVACMELHTFSSLNKDFLSQYRGTMAEADTGIIFYNPETVTHKNLQMIGTEDILSAFDQPGLKVITDTGKLAGFLGNLLWKDKTLLLMSSGNFGGLDFQEILKKIM